MQKNVSGQKWLVFAFDRTDNTPVTGDAANITAKIRKDYGTATATNDTNPTEIEDGYYEFDLTQAESNADVLDLLPESSTADVQVIGCPARIFTGPPNWSLLGIESDGDLTKVNALDGHTAQTGDSYARLGSPVGASVSADLATVDGNVDTLLTRVPNGIFSGMTSLAQWLGLIAGKQTGDSTARTELRATGAGSGTYDETIDSQEAIRDTAPLGTAMRGTDGANTATPLDAAGTRSALGMSAANLDTQLGDIPTVSEFNARTQPTADYFDPAADEVDVGSIKGTALTETNAGDLADSFSFFYDVDPTTTKTVNDVGVSGSGLTQQQVRDAMKLAPTGGAPSAGSVDEHLDDALANVATVDTVVDAIKAVTDNLPDAGALNDLATLATRLTAARAGYLDNLNIGENVAGTSEVTAIQNNTRIVFTVPQMIERPDSGSKTLRLWLYLYDEIGNMEAPDSTPTVTVANDQGTDRSGNLGSVTLDATGVYYVDYTIADSHAIEALRFQVSVTEGGSTILKGAGAHVVDTTAVDFTAADRTKLDTLHDTRITAARMGALDDLLDGGRIDVLIDAIKAVTDNLPDAGALTTIANNVAAILDDTGTNGVVLTSAERDAIANALLDLTDAVETGITVRELMRAQGAVLGGTTTGDGTVFKSLGGSTTRVTTTMSGKDRTSVGLSL